MKIDFFFSLFSEKMEITVDKCWFGGIVIGDKKVEGRSLKDKFKNLNVGDKITFTDGDNKYHAVVNKLTNYNSFREMLISEKIENVLPEVLTIEEGCEIYRKFYSEDLEKKYGVLAISFNFDIDYLMANLIVIVEHVNNFVILDNSVDANGSLKKVFVQIIIFDMILVEKNKKEKLNIYYKFLSIMYNMILDKYFKNIEDENYEKKMNAIKLLNQDDDYKVYSKKHTEETFQTFEKQYIEFKNLVEEHVQHVEEINKDETYEKFANKTDSIFQVIADMYKSSKKNMELKTSLLKSTEKCLKKFLKIISKFKDENEEYVDESFEFYERNLDMKSDLMTRFKQLKCKKEKNCNEFIADFKLLNIFENKVFSMFNYE